MRDERKAHEQTEEAGKTKATEPKQGEQQQK